MIKNLIHLNICEFCFFFGHRVFCKPAKDICLQQINDHLIVCVLSGLKATSAEAWGRVTRTATN